jgi:signal transduction histidine kinase
MSQGPISQGDFVTMLLAHDISNYNQTSRGYLEMLLDEQMGPVAEEQGRALTICLRQSYRIQSLIESVRLLYDLDAARPVFEVMDLDAAIRETIDAVQGMFSDRDIRVRFAPSGRETVADSNLGVIFKHLLTNAVRHSNAEVVEIDIDISKTTDDPRAPWRILVRDNGEGVPPARQPELFARLETRSIHGTGLGLSMVRRLAERYGGKVWLAASHEGQGAIFGLELPAAAQ